MILYMAFVKKCSKNAFKRIFGVSAGDLTIIKKYGIIPIEKQNKGDRYYET